MATSSRYVLLKPSVLMEYVYADRSVINDAGNEFRISTSSYPIWLMANGRTSVPQVFNSDASASISDGLPQGTGNVRDRSFAYLSDYRGALLDIDKVTFYNDYDAQLTNTGSLPVSFANEKAPVYDTIKLHLVQGFNFQDNLGLTITASCKDRNGNRIVLANIAYTRNDLWETLNPTSFTFAGRNYDSYLEFRLLSLYDLVYEYWLGTLDGDTVVEKITGGVGVQRDQPIEITFSWIRNTERLDGQDYIDLYDTVEVDLPQRDQFEAVTGVIREANGADYIEFYAAHNGSIIENYITDLNSSGGDYIVLHDLVVSEYVYDSSSNSYSWVQTDVLQMSQASDFDRAQTFRPVVRSGGAVAFKIDYTVRLWNRADNTQVWKTSSMTSRSANKYGRRLKQINLGSNPVQTTIYNRIVAKDFTLTPQAPPVVEQTKYVTSFVDTSNVGVSFEVLQGATATTSTPRQDGMTTAGGSSRVIPNGLGRIFVPESTSYLRLVLHRRRGDSYELLNVTGIGDMTLSFSDGRGDAVVVQEFPDTFADKGAGEVVFRVTETQARQVLALDDRSFAVHLENERGERTLVYSGRFYSVAEYQALVEEDRITELEAVVAGQSTTIEELSALVDAQQERIAELVNKTTGLSATLASDDDLIRTLRDTIDDLKSRVTGRTDFARREAGAASRAVGKVPAESQRPAGGRGRGFYEEEASKMKADVSKSKTSPYTP